MFTFTKTATSHLRQADRPTSDSSEVNLRLALRWRHAYGRKYYTIVNHFSLEVAVTTLLCIQPQLTS